VPRSDLAAALAFLRAPRRRFTVESLAERLDVSPRTAYRLIATLRAEGLIEPHPSGGWGSRFRLSRSNNALRG